LKRIYLDYAASTPLDPRVVETMGPYLENYYGNASSTHSFGQEAKKALEESRVILANFMNADGEEVIFTGGATESNNFVLQGHAFSLGRRRAHIAVSTVEHDCVLNSAK